MIMKYFFYSCVLILLVSCGYVEKHTQRLINEWIGKEVVLPSNIPTKILGRDTNCTYLLEKPIKILVYTDSVGCTACKLNFYDWMQKIESLSHLQDLSILFYVHTKNYKTFTNALKGEAFNYPIFYDSNNVLAKTNHFPTDNRFHTFLLNEKNEVLLIGNPLGNPQMWKLYVQQINSMAFYPNNSNIKQSNQTAPPDD